MSEFQLDNVNKIQVNEQLGNLLSFFDHTEAMISTNDIRTKTILTQALSLQMTRGEGLAKSLVISSEELLFLRSSKTNKQTNPLYYIKP